MKLCRLSFSLRTLLAVVTMLAFSCGYVTGQAEIVRRRKAERTWLETHGAHFLEFWDQRPLSLRGLFGDQEIAVILLPGGDIDERAKNAFPEADIQPRGFTLPSCGFVDPP